MKVVREFYELLGKIIEHPDVYDKLVMNFAKENKDNMYGKILPLIYQDIRKRSGLWKVPYLDDTVDMQLLTEENGILKWNNGITIGSYPIARTDLGKKLFMSFIKEHKHVFHGGNNEGIALTIDDCLFIFTSTDEADTIEKLKPHKKVVANITDDKVTVTVDGEVVYDGAPDSDIIKYFF